jgi:hypothetical protein
MGKHIPPTIEEMGLKNFLIQKGIDFDEFCRRDDLKEPDAIIARALGVKDRRTIAAWREIRKKEQGND